MKFTSSLAAYPCSCHAPLQPLRARLAYERQQLYARFATDDAHEGLAAIVAKRKPVFTHA